MAQYTQSYPTLSEAAYNNLFRYSNQPGQPANPLQGQYQVVVDAANRAGIPPSLFAAIIAQESGFGRYNPRQTGGGRIYTHNNPAGIMDPATRHRDPMRYGSFQEGLDAAARTAARIYNRGGTVLPTIQNIYAPTDPQPANDPSGLNRHWLPNVTRFLQNIAGTMSSADYEALLPEINNTIFQQEGVDQGPPGGMGGIWGNDYLESINERSAAAGYQLPAGVAEFVQRTVPSLAAGPEGFSAGDFPWFSPGAIGQDVGTILQHHGFMPNNLIYNPETQVWDFQSNPWLAPSSTGIWGAQQVASLLPNLGEGFQRDYLTHIGYGATQEHNYGGLSNAYYGAPNLYGAPSSGQLGGGWNIPGAIGPAYGAALQQAGQGAGLQYNPETLVWDPVANPALGMGNQGFGNIADMSTYGYQPFNYNSYFGALGNPSVYSEPLMPAVDLSYLGDELAPGSSSPYGAVSPGSPGAVHSGFVNPVPTTIAGNNESFGNVAVQNTFPTQPYGYGSPIQYTGLNVQPTPLINPNGILGPLAYGF